MGEMHIVLIVATANCPDGKPVLIFNAQKHEFQKISLFFYNSTVEKLHNHIIINLDKTYPLTSYPVKL